jgi:hypothetical protein
MRRLLFALRLGIRLLLDAQGLSQHQHLRRGGLLWPTAQRPDPTAFR